MRKTLKFRPVVNDSQLEDRVVMTTTAIHASAATLPVVTHAAVTNTLNQIHAALLSYSSTVTTALMNTESQIASGKVTEANASSQLSAYLGKKLSLLAYQTRGASTNLPYGASFNGYVNPTTGLFSDLPSGAVSLYGQLTQSSPQPGLQIEGPILILANNVEQALFSTPGSLNFNGALAAVNSAAIHSTYQQVKIVVANYVSAGVKAHDFTN